MRRFYAHSSILVLSVIVTLVSQPLASYGEDRLPAATQVLLAPSVTQVAGWEGGYEVAPAPGAVASAGISADCRQSAYCPQDDCPQPPMRYDLPSKHYGIWTRPAAFAEDSADNCKSMRPFAPRGYGFPYRHACERLDYSPYQLKTLPCTHGPAYYGKSVNAPCKACMQRHH